MTTLLSCICCFLGIACMNLYEEKQRSLRRTRRHQNQPQPPMFL